MSKIVTLDEFIIKRQKDFQYATGELTGLLRDIGIAAKIINRDVQRILFQGGIFLYPNTRKYPQGKLRLLYECNPLAFIVEQAEGKAISCQLERILELPVGDLHQRMSIAIGSPDMMDEMKAFVERYKVPEFKEAEQKE